MTTTAVRATSRAELHARAGHDPDAIPFERRFIRQVWVTVDVNATGDAEAITVAAWWMARARRQRRAAHWARHAYWATLAHADDGGTTVAPPPSEAHR